MQHYVGLDVSVKETSVCIVDKAGKVIREVKVATKPAEILAVLTEEALAIERIGLEAGPLSQWLYGALAEAGLPVICVETRHMKAALSAQINKSDRNDARGIAQMMRVGLYRPVHVKTLASQKRRMLLTSRQLLQAKALDIENDLRGTLRNFGLKVGMVGTVKFEARICELVADHPDLAAIVEPLLIARRVLREQLGVLHRVHTPGKTGRIRMLSGHNARAAKRPRSWRWTQSPRTGLHSESFPASRDFCRENAIFERMRKAVHARLPRHSSYLADEFPNAVAGKIRDCCRDVLRLSRGNPRS